MIFPANVHWHINSHIDEQEVQDDDELERELEALLAPQKGRAPCTTNKTEYRRRLWVPE